MKKWFFFCMVSLCFFLLPLYAKTTAAQGVVQVRDDAGKPVEGAVFQLYCDGMLQQELQSDEKGNVVLRDLSVGEYLLVQSQASNGYQKCSDHIEFYYDTTVEMMKWKVVNERIQGSVEVQLHNNDGKQIDKVSLQLQDEQGTIIREIDTANASIQLTNLPVGTYHIKLQEHQHAYGMKNDVTFAITPNNDKRHVVLHLYLQQLTKQEEFPRLAIGFMVVVVVFIAGVIYYFRKHSLTQFLDDVMI